MREISPWAKLFQCYDKVSCLAQLDLHQPELLYGILRWTLSQLDTNPVILGDDTSRDHHII